MLSMLALAVLVTAAPSRAPAAAVASPEAIVDTASIRFARAREQARHGRAAEAMREYLAGARVAVSPSDWALYRRDIAWIAEPSELKAFDAAADGGRAELLATFWSSRDRRDGLAAGGRFVEHVRRLDIALADYRVRPKRGKAPVSRVSGGSGDSYDYAVGRNSMLRDFAPAQGEIDDRGVILVRHGEPDARSASVAGVESWIYEREDKDNLVVHFSENVFDGSSGNTRLIAAPPVASLEALCGLDSPSCAVAQRMGGATPERRERLRQRALSAIRVLTTTETAARHTD